MKIRTIRMVAISAALAPIIAQANLLNVQFGGTTEMTGSAVVGAAGDTWNHYQTTGSQNLVDSTGATQPTSISWTAQQIYDPSNSAFDATEYGPLMKGYLVGDTDSYTITVDGLAASSACSVYVYCQGDSAAEDRRISLSLNDAEAVISTAASASENTFIENQNYVKLTGTTDTTGALSIDWTQYEGEANINGLQIESAIPEPATLALFGLTGLGLYTRRIFRL